MNAKKHITGIILAGGKSSRMGTDKGFVLYNNKPFIKHSIDALRPLVDTILIVSDNPDYDSFNCTRVDDAFKNAGPLAGLYSGLQQSETETNLILSCDVPLVNTSLLQHLLDENTEDATCIQFESQGKTMPLIALYKKQCLSTCLELLNAGERRLQALTHNLNTTTIALNGNLGQFTTNINTPEALNALTMTLQIKYFGMLTDITQCQEETLSFSQQTVSDLLEILQNKYPLLENTTFKVAQNQEFISGDTLISSPEIALLPPFSGG